MVLKKLTFKGKWLFLIVALACPMAYASGDLKVTILDVPVISHHDNSFLSIQVAQEPANLFDSVSLAKIHKGPSTKFFNTHKKILSSKIKIAEQHFQNGSKAEYLLVVKRHSLFLKFQFTE